MEKNEWYGIDTSIDESLQVYGLLVKEIEDSMVELLYNHLDNYYYYLTDIDTINEYSNEIADYCNIPASDWLELDTANKITDIFSYNGLYEFMNGHVACSQSLTLSEINTEYNLNLDLTYLNK